MATPTILLVALCAGLNLALGGIVFLLKLPIYLDLVGSLLCALVLAETPGRAFAASTAAGLASFVVAGLFNPYLPWFSLTAVAVAAFTAFVTGRFAAGLRDVPAVGLGLALRVLALGAATGVVAAVVSAPVVVYLFGGVTGSGSALLVAFFLKAGNQLLNAAVLSGMTAEPVDKTLQLALAVALLRATPRSFLTRLQAESSGSGGRR